MQGFEIAASQFVAPFASLDATRRRQGAWLDVLGFAPVRTPSRVMWEGPRARLLAYDRPASGPALLIVPAPIKRAYIWDLAPEVSAVRRCLGAGFAVHMLEWLDPDEADADLGIEAHVNQVIAPAIEAVLAATGARRAVLAGHSLGGTLAAIAASVRSEHVAGLLLIETPLAFDGDAGAIARFMVAMPPATVEELGDRCVPGSFLSSLAVMAAPDEFLWSPSLDWVASAATNTATLHGRVRRWTEDELAMPGRLFVDLVEGLYRKNRFALGTLSVGGAPVDPGKLATIPLLIVVEHGSAVVPPHSALGLFATVMPKSLHRLCYQAETGVALQHVGALVGYSAHRLLWPKILTWLELHG